MSDKPKPPPKPSPAADGHGLEELIALKKAKIAELRERGVDPFPSRTVRQHDCACVARLGQALAEPMAHSAEKVSIAGRLVELRDMGKSIFGRLADLSGRAQVYFKKDALQESVFALVKKDLHVGDFLSVSGAVFITKTGEPTVAVESATMLAKAVRPLPEKWHGLTDTELRYRQRHLDLVSTAESRETFIKRARLVSTIRRVLDARGYIEVETPVLIGQAGGASARPFHTHHNALDQDMVLRIATELYLKKLVIGGLDRVYEIGRVFRNEGVDTRHNPEFTMLEAYEAYSDYEGMAALFETLLTECAEACGVCEVEWLGKHISLKAPFKRLYLPEVWKDRCGEPIENVLEGKGFNRAGLLKLAYKLGVHAGEKTPSSKVFDRIVETRIEDLLQQPTFLFDHPTAITPLAKLKPGTESIVERFECFAAGIELSNAYSELNDPQDQRDRLTEQMKQSAAGDAEVDLLDEDFIQSMEAGMPPMGGIGVGIDRLTMLLTGRDSIRDVILFPTLKRAAVAGLLLASLLAPACARAAEIRYAKGQVTVERGQISKPAAEGAPIEAGDRIRTGERSTAVVDLGEGAVVKLRQQSAFVIGENFASVHLDAGGLFARLIAKLNKKHNFQVRTPMAVCAVKGTEFFTAYGRPTKKGRDLWVCVNKGVVEIESLATKKKIPIKEGKGVILFEGSTITPPQVYDWTKKLNWKMDAEEGELEDRTSLDGAYSDLLDQNYE